MITGESGTGKELVARAIHRHGPRKNDPFVPVHVAALNPNLVESELFGHEKGAFTNATHASQGLLSLAGKGTLFLDEIAEIPLPVQVKLLRVLEQGTFHAVGSTRELRLEARVLAATHQDLVQRCAENQFRQDLLFRLNVFGIHLPPLRDRGADIKILAESIATSIDARCPPLSEATLQALTSRPWTGNVRELRNALEHAVILARGGPILPGHLPPPVKAEIGSADGLRKAVHQWLDHAIGSEPEPRDLWERFVGATEPAIIEEVLRRVGGNRLHAAQWLGINRSTLRRKLADGELHPE
jgi:two-component system nitrogen regulation response regulator GlnG